MADSDIATQAEEAAASIDDPMTRCIATTYWAKGYAKAMRDIVEFQQRLRPTAINNEVRPS